jgi:hypothetical protein
MLNTGAIRETWLEAAIEQTVTSDESRTRLKAADITERVADC